MKYIVKNAEPQELLDWKTRDKMFLRGRPNYDRIRNDPAAQLALFNSLRAEQGNICCYCERELRIDDCHIEHIAPQTRYTLLSCSYENMICSCLKNEVKGDPSHCGMSKGSWYVEDDFISPLDGDCESKFKYTFDGHILPANDEDQAATITIDKCKLDIPLLCSMRKKVIEIFIDEALSDEELGAFVTAYLADKDQNGGSFNIFYTTINDLFGHFRAEN